MRPYKFNSSAYFFVGAGVPDSPTGRNLRFVGAACGGPCNNAECQEGRQRQPLHTRLHISSFIHGRAECAPTFCFTICRERRPRRSTGDNFGCGEMERRGRRSLHIGTSYIIVIHGRTECAPTFCLDIRMGGRPRPPESFVRTDGSPRVGSPTYTTAYIIVVHGRTECAPTILIRPRSGHHNYALSITNYALNKIRIEQKPLIKAEKCGIINNDYYDKGR